MRNFVLATAFAVSLLLTPVLAEDRALSVPPGGVGHVLTAEDGQESLARFYGVTVSSLRSANPEAAWREGEAIAIPRPPRAWPTHTVRTGETLWRIGKAYGISVEQLRQANQLTDNTLFRGTVLVLPRAERPDWTLPETTPVVTAVVATPSSVEGYGSAAPPKLPPKAAPKLQGQWVEVRLPDNRRAWAPVGTLVVGSWQPQSPDQVILVGRSFVGVPYKWGGVDPNGWDCSGFMQELFRLGGHQVPRLADAQYEACVRVSVPELQPGDMVFFNTDGSGVSHVGIYTGDRRFLHASSSRGVVEDSLDDSYFAARYCGAGRLPAWQTSTQPIASEADDDVHSDSED